MNTSRLNRPHAISWPFGLLGMLILVGGLERGIARHANRFRPPNIAGWAEARRSLDSAARADVIAMGDSLIKHGLAPRVVEHRLGRSTSNLGVVGGRPVGFYFQLRRLLNAGARPAALLVDGEVLPNDPLEIPRLWPELLAPWECAELAWAARDGSAFAQMALAWALPSCRARAELRLDVMGALRGERPKAAWDLPPVQRNWRRNQGAELLPPRDDPPGTDPRPALLDRQGYRPEFWACHPLNAIYLGKLLDLAAARGVRVFWLLPPLHPEVQARRDLHGQGEKYARFVQSIAARYPNVTVIDGRHAGYPAEVLADMTHLNRLGAVAFSDGVAECVAGCLAGTTRANWVELPRWRAGRAERIEDRVAVEDVRQSARAMSVRR